MKSSTAKNAESVQSSNTFFNTEKSKEAFFADSVSEKPIFFPSVQPKLTIGKPNDSYEKEADAIADKVVAAQSAPVIQRQKDEELLQEKPLADTITPIVQLEREDEEMLQSKPIFESPGGMDLHSSREQETEGQTLQAKDATATPSPDFGQRLAQNKGSGDALPSSTQAQMESSFGTDFSGVKTHTGSNAVQMSSDIGAQAFTHGNDIYFNEGKFNPGTQEGDHLLAHELTHTVQQGENSDVQGRMIQKEGDENVTLPPTAGTEEVGLVNSLSNTITYNNVTIPAFKGLDHRGIKYNSWNLKRSKNYNSNTRPSNQQQIWKNNISTETIIGELRQKAQDAQFQPTGETYVFEAPARPLTRGARHVARGQKHYYIGTLSDIAKASSAPAWNKRGSLSASMEVDHIVELQISGYPDEGSSAAHSIANMELLERRPNRMSGDVIKGSINDKIDATLRNNETKALLEQEISGLKNERNRNKKRSLIKRNFDLVFTAYNSSGGPRINENSFWSRDIVERGDHLNKIEAGDFSQLGEEGRILIFPTMSGGIGKTFLWDGTNLDPNRGNKEHEWLKPFEITSKSFNTNNQDPNTPFGQFQIQIPENKRDTYKAMSDTIPINRIPGASFAGRLSKQSVQRSAEKLELEELSPLTVEYIDISTQEGITMGGKVLPSVPFISSAQLEYRISGNDLSVFRVFEVGDLNIPPPFSISNSSLTVEISSERGISISGRVNFGINNVGDGFIGAAASTSGGFELEGAFNFDSELFDPAEINIEYKNDIWTVGGEIGIPEGKVRGVKNATITASYSEGNFTATGDAELDVPGIERGTMNVNYGDEGFSISGNFDLSPDIPGIRGGNVEARVSKDEGAENYDVFVTGTAQPDIPGISSSLTVTYENGALSIVGNASYSRGLLSGSVNVGATNRTIAEDGQPTGEPDDTMRVYGGGSLTLQLTPWLEATAGVQFLPNGEIEVKGRIGLPNTVDVFDRRQFDRNLFSMPQIEIPIFAIPLGPKSLGIVATINGGLDFTAGFGPGQLQELFGEVTYNPARPEETTLAGRGRFVIPADAGLTLSADLGLGLSIGFASLTGGIEIAGALGLEGEAIAEVGVDWSPSTGLEINARGAINVRPKFTFDINLLARASINLPWPLPDISKTWRHNLYSFQWGPDIVFGIAFPIHYVEGQPFNISFDDLEVTYPELNIGDMAKGLGREIKNRVF